jgi:imidazolonepropionase-like amidohydrolase
MNAILTAAVGLVSAAGPACAEDVLAFRNVRVFDGARAIPITTVVIRGDRLDRLDPGGAIPERARVIDGQGKTLLPGLIDGHTHAFFPDHLKQAVIFGVTTELDMFTGREFAARMRSQQSAGKAFDRADLRSAGTLVTAPGGHGTEYGVRIECRTDFA